MKLKGINPFEQHIEKIALGVALAAVAGVATWQFISAPSVTVGGRAVSPNQVDDVLEQKARALQERLRGDSNINIPSDGVQLAAPSFQERLNKPVSPASTLAVNLPAFGSALARASASVADVWYYEPKLAAVKMESVVQTADALTPEAAKLAAAASGVVKARFSETTGPQDVVWTTPVATLDVKAMRAELARSDASAKPPRAAIPSVWYLETPFVVDVVFERRERKNDGTWSEPQTVPVFSARDEAVEFRPRVAGADAGLREDMFAVLGNATNQLSVLQMPFYDTVNDSFVSPALAKDQGTATKDPGDAMNSRRMLQLRTQLENKRRQAAKLTDELTKLGGPWDEAKEKEEADRRKQDEKTRKDSEKGNKGGSGFGMGGGGMQGRNTGAGEDAKDREAKAARERQARMTKTQALHRIQKDIAALEQQLGATPTTASTAPVTVPSLVTEDQILVWGHDLEVEPGHTYQYRAKVCAYNPFFAKGNQLVKEQDEKGLAKSFVLESAVSEWSEPVTVSPRVRFFVTRASAGDGALGLGTAQVEVYRLVDGQWRRSEMQVQPGERIGRVDEGKGNRKTVDFTTDYYVASIVEDLTNTEAGKHPAVVVVRPMNEGESQVRVPAGELEDSERQRLREEAASALAAAEKPAEKPAPPAGSGGPAGPGGGPGGGGGLSGGNKPK